MAMLEQLTQRHDAAPAACLTLAELAFEEQDWELALRSADRALSINPLLRGVHERACTHRGRTGPVVAGGSRL